MATIASPTCNNSTLAPFAPSASSPWNLARIKHAYRRLSFGTTESEALAKLNVSPDSFIEGFINSAYSLQPTTAPQWGLYAKKDFGNYQVQNIENQNSWSIQTAKDVLNDGFR